MADPDAIWAMYVARYGSNGPIPQEQTVAVDAITGFIRHQAAELDAATAREQATIEAAWTFASAWGAREPGSSYPAGAVPGIPAIRGMRIAENAIDRFIDHQRAGQTPLAAYLLAVEHAEASQPGHRPEQTPQPGAEQAGPNREAELERDQALADAPEDVRDAYWQSRDLARDEPEPELGP